MQIVENEPSLIAFLKKLDWGVAVLANYDACRRVAYENVEDLLRAGIDYAELRFSPAYMAMAHAAPAGCGRGYHRRRGGRQPRLRHQDQPDRHHEPHLRHRAVQARAGCLSGPSRSAGCHRSGRRRAGLPGELFTDHFRRVRDAGMRVTVHAGEAAGPESMWQAIRELGAERIGHGVKAIQDPALMAYLAEHRIGIESRLTSNVQTTTVASLTEHPIRQFLAAGVLVCLNTDDPAVEGIDLPHEYEVAAPAAGMTVSEICTAQQNGLTLAFLSEAEKAELSARAAQR